MDDNIISDWSEVCRLAGLPALNRLSLSGNPLNSICYPAHNIPTTALLDQQPPVGDRNNAAIKPEQQQQQQQPPFAVLEALLLGGCQLSSWSDVDALNQFPALGECRLTGNPLFAVEGSAAGAGRRFEVRLLIRGAVCDLVAHPNPSLGLRAGYAEGLLCACHCFAPHRQATQAMHDHFASVELQAVSVGVVQSVLPCCMP